MTLKIQNVVVGAGITGLTIAERLATKGEDVLIIEKRNHIGGNCYDWFDEDGCYIQEYGPHIFHTEIREVYEYLSQFTEWHEYQHRVLGFVNGKLIPIPFNLDSLYLSFSQEFAKKLETKLIKKYGFNKRVPITTLRKEDDEDLKFLAEYIFEKVFLNYTIKQWGVKPEEIDESVLARVPVVISKDPRYFHDRYQGIPKKGFTKLFERMIDNPKIKILLNTDYKTIIKQLSYDRLFYTGHLDYFFDYKYGKIKYRAVLFKREKLTVPSYQQAAVINYPNDFEYTRITEFNKFLDIERESTNIIKEYASWDKGIKAYPVQDEENKKLIEKYLQEGSSLKNIYFVGRLAECRYYNIDKAVERALEVVKRIEEER